MNNSVLIANMQEDGIKLLATNDIGFEKVKEIFVCKPGDVDLS